MSIQQFRNTIQQVMTKRADATLDLIDALTIAGHVESPVALSEEPLFRRVFSGVYDVLEEAELDQAALAKVLYEAQPPDSETIAGYEVYAVDTTPNERPAAETLPDRTQLKASKDEPVRIGHKYSWLARLVKRETSWVAPQDVCRVKSDTTDNRVAVEQVKVLDQRSNRPKVVVADSLYGNVVFLAVFLVVTTVAALVRLRHNLVLYEQPEPKAPGSKGAPRKHGPKFRLSNPRRPPDRQESVTLFGQTVRLSAWHGLHFYKLPALVGMVLRVEFLKADGTPRYKRPLCLFWTGSWEVVLSDLCLMYLWRFALEHAFRFLKQHLGLNANQSTHLHSTELWMWLCALAYWQLLLMQKVVADYRPAWYRRSSGDAMKPLTPGLVQRAALRFLVELGTPAATPKRTGKGTGRPKGYRPAPRQRYAVVKKAARPSRSARKVAAQT